MFKYLWGEVMKRNIRAVIFVAICMAAVLFVFPVKAEATSGTCGDNLTWEYDTNTCTLTISGQGEMDSGNHAPWYDYNKTCTAVVIEKGITSIGYGAFSGFSLMHTISVPDTVTSIGGYAFYNCRNLTRVPLHKGVTDIQRYAFQNCSGFTEVTIPSGVTVIGYGAFSGCTKISRLTIPESVKEIDSYAFEGCSALTSLVIPDSVTVVGGSSFMNCSNLQSVTLSKNLQKIPNHGFSYCTSLTKIVIPDSVTEIETYAFTGCTALTDISFGAGVSAVYSSSFGECSALRAFKVSNSNRSFYTHEGVLYSHTDNKMVLMPPGYTGSHTVPEGVTRIGDRACYGCKALTQITICGSVTQIEEYAFDDCEALKKVVLNEGLEEVGFRAFFLCEALEEIIFPATLENIGYQAFYYCTSLSKITFRGSMVVIDDNAFTEVKATVYYPGGDTTWNSVGRSFGGSFTWVAVSCKGAHSYGNWLTQLAPTAQLEGLAVRRCTYCGATDKKLLEKTGMQNTAQTTPSGNNTTQTIVNGNSIDGGDAADNTQSAQEPETQTTIATGGDQQIQSVEGTLSGQEMIPETTQLPLKEEKERSESGAWVVIVAIIGIVVVADAVIGVIYLKKRKKMQ